MQFTENLKQAFISLSTNKLRSILTMLGIVMGVFSIVAIMAISNAAKSFMSNEFNKLGANTIILRYRTNSLEDQDLLTLKDLDIIVKAMDEVNNITASRTIYSTIKLPNNSRDAQVTGVTSQYTSFQTIDLKEGRFISESDVQSQRRVAVVLDNFAKRYFGTTDIIGEEIKLVNNYGDIMKLKIVGVQSTEGDLFASMMDNEDFPVNVTMPITTSQVFYGRTPVDTITVSVKDKADLKATGEKLVKLLEFIHKNTDIYLATSVEDIQKSVGSVLNVISMVLVVIAIITLLVGGIGIINILLVSVTERIREIGLRKALGARKRDIIMQFLTESIIMTGFSGLIGIIIGLITGAIISSVINIPPVVDVWTTIIAFVSSVVLGIMFGVYPAKKAADLDPIESLRYE